MSQHSERTQFGPSRTSVVAGAVLVIASAVATGYMTAGLSLDLRDALGFALGVGFTGLLAFHVLAMVGERAVVADRAKRAAERERREASEMHAELNAWQNATGALLDAYLSGQAVDFRGEPVPGYVRTRLADAAPLAPPTYPEPEPEPPYAPVDEGPAVLMDRVVHDPGPGSPLPYVVMGPVERHAAAVLDRVVAEQTGEHRSAQPSYQRPPTTPWNAFEAARRPELESVPVPLPPRGEPAGAYVDPGPYSSFVPVSPGREPDWSGIHADADTEVIGRVGDSSVDPDATEVIDRVR